MLFESCPGAAVSLQAARRFSLGARRDVEIPYLERLVFSPTQTPFSRDISQSLAPLGQASDWGKWSDSVNAAE